MVAIESVLQLFQFSSNWVSFGKTKEALKRERALYRASAGPYARAADALRLLAERTEALAATETAAWADSVGQEQTA